MTPVLARSFEKLERQKTEALGEIAAWSPERLRFRPDPASWSTLDVLDHLMKVEQALLKAVMANLPHGQPVSLRSRLGARLVIGVMRSRLRVKVPPAATSVLPGAKLDPAGLGPRWTATRDELGALLATLSREQLRRGLFRHPVSGWMTMPHAVTFLAAHFGHHQRQLARLRHASQGM